jgi:hypothetical protein
MRNCNISNMVQLAQALGQFFGEKGTGLEILVCGDSSFGANLLMLSCNRKSDSDEVVKGLPELPPELAANLTSTKIDNVLMTKNSPPVQKAAVKPGPARQRCLPQGILGDFPGLSYDSVFSAPATARRRGGRGQGASGRVRLVACCATTPRYYKLSKAAALHVPLRLLCRVSAGPWYATAQTQESCGESPPVTIVTFQGAPQPLTVGWFGEIDEGPPPFTPPTIFRLKTDGDPGKCTCCGDYKMCFDQSGRPSGCQLSCPDGVIQ